MYNTDTQTKIDDQPLAGIAAGLMHAWNSHDVEQVMSFYAPGYEGIDVGRATPEHGPDGKRETVLVYLGAFPDLHFDVEEIIVQGNVVVACWTAHGTHRGPFMHIPATGRPVLVRGTSRLTIANGKILSAVYVWDVAGLLRHIGLLPDL